jgi:hypothetical protein
MTYLSKPIDPNAPSDILAQFDDAELIAELERRTRAALRRADDLSTAPLAPWCGAKVAEPEEAWTAFYGDWRADVIEGSARLHAAIDAAGLHP